VRYYLRSRCGESQNLVKVLSFAAKKRLYIQCAESGENW
jgi:hypothetical protein